MENSPGLTDNKAIIAYLCEKFPACFTQTAEVKPLKIGIFKDLSERLGGEGEVSKTRLRQAIRYYTSSLRYLDSIKQGAKRVDLNGNECEEIDEQHEAHASERAGEVRERIKERKAKIAEERKTKQAEERKQRNEQFEKGDKRPPARRASNKSRGPKPTSKPRREAHETEVLKPIALENIKVGASVKVLVGTNPVLAEVKEIRDANVQVQLNSGMTITVPVDKIVGS